MAFKNTKQRKMILEVLVNSHEHLSAEQVYDLLQSNEETKHIGLATVYRNLNVLTQTNQIVRIFNQDLGHVYDGNIHPHYHLKCTQCGELVDFDMPYQHQLDVLANAENDGYIASHDIVFTGICKECLGKTKN